MATLNPEFFRVFEFHATMPGESQLKLKVNSSKLLQLMLLFRYTVGDFGTPVNSPRLLTAKVWMHTTVRHNSHPSTA